jgi:polyisoprenoid-binding protein YceI
VVIARVHGRFARWAGAVELDLEDPTRSSVEVRIDAASVDTQLPTAAPRRTS